MNNWYKTVLGALMVFLIFMGAADVGLFPTSRTNLIIGGGYANGGSSFDKNGNADFAGDVIIDGTLTGGGVSGGATTEAELESDLTDVDNVFTNNDTIGDANVANDLTINSTKDIATTGDVILNNTKNVRIKDSGGTPRPLLTLWTDNTTYRDGPGKQVFRVNTALTALTLNTDQSVDFTGPVTVGGTRITSIKTPIWLPAGSATPTTTNGAANATVDSNDAWSMSFSKDDLAWWQIFIPSTAQGWDGSIENITVYWYMSGAMEDVTWSLAAVVFSDTSNTAMSAAYGSENSASADGSGETVGTIQETSISASNLLGGTGNAGLFCKVRLKATTAAGSFTNEPLLVGVKMEY